MIIKELDPFASEDKFAKAGRVAEEHMAFYLRRYFGERPDVHVLNGVRLEADGDAAQVDHLVIHPQGMVIVESKSVHGKAQIKDDGQWIRWYGDNKSKGIPSPITQAKLQAAFFRSYLNKAANPKGFFDSMPMDVLVSISDEGVIIRPKSGGYEEVLKADQICDRINGLIEELNRSRESKPFLVSEHIAKLSDYLSKVHKPLVPKAERVTQTEVKAVEPPPKAEPKKGLLSRAAEAIAKKFDAVSSGKICKHCGGTSLEIKYGHSYYFRCLDCGKNTPVKAVCPTCNRSETVHKKGNEFYAECAYCKTSRLLHVNK